MRRRTAVAAVAVGTAFALLLGACGKSDNGSKSGTSGSTPSFNAAVGKVYSPSTKKGGTIRYGFTDEWDSLDPGDTYYGYSWDFVRYYGRSLVMFKPGAGAETNQLVPDLAESLGKPSDDAKTWTYTIRKGLKFEDGTPITSKDVKYAVERSLDKDTFPNGPTYFNDFLDLQGYTTVAADTDPDKLGLKAIETPDDNTIVFHLKSSFAGFDYFAMLPSTIPVPRAKDTGTKYKEHVVSSGPYMFDTYVAGQSFSLKRNPNWDPATDPYRAALPDRVEVKLKMNAVDVDKQLLNGTLDVDVAGTGVQPATQATLLANDTNKKNVDTADIARLWFTTLNEDVAPLSNIDCRKAILYAADHESYLKAYGGSAGGKIATTLLPSQIPGSPKTDPYGFLDKPNGDVDKAKAALTACGQPNGFSINISYRSDRPKEQAVAEGLQQSLAKVGIKLTLKGFPTGDYTKLYAGKPEYAKANNIGMSVYGWGADWTDGFGFLQQIVDSRVIRPAGNTNLGVRDPEVDKLIDKALVTTDADARNKIWGDVDLKVMSDAFVLPGVWSSVVLYRSPNLTNVGISEGLGGFVDYVQLGVKQ